MAVLGVTATVGEAASVRVRSGGISPGGTRVGVASSATTVGLGLATTWGEGSSVGLGRVQPPITMMAATMVKVNTIAVDAPLLMACLLFKSTKPELGFVSSNESLAVRSQGIVSLSPLTHPSNFCT